MNPIAPAPAAPPAAPQADDKLPLWRKIGYGLGDIYGGGSGVVVSFYYLIFLTDVVRLNPALAGTVILISKGYDAITDPLEGVLSDRTRTPAGPAQALPAGRHPAHLPVVRRPLLPDQPGVGSRAGLCSSWQLTCSSPRWSAS